MTSSQLYDPYGTLRYSSGSSPTSLGYTGQRADASTGLDFYHARYYDPVAGQFASADTVADGLNRYGYVGGNPTTATDPSGHRLDSGARYDSGAGDLFYAQYLARRADRHLMGGTYLAPDALPGDAKSQKLVSPEVYTLASNVAVRQDQLGGRAAYRMVNGKRVYVQTAGQASVTIYAIGDTKHEHPLETLYSDMFDSQGDGQHAEQLSIDAIAAEIKEFVAAHTSSGLDGDKFVYDVNVMAAMDPCTNCKLDSQYAAWKNDIAEAIGVEGCDWNGGDACDPSKQFRLRMWYLTGDPSSPRGPNNEDTSSAFHIWHDSKWPTLPGPGGYPSWRVPPLPDDFEA